MAAQYIGKFTQKMISGQSGQQAVKPAVQSDRIADIAMLCRNGKRLIDIAQLLNGFIGNMRIRKLENQRMQLRHDPVIRHSFIQIDRRDAGLPSRENIDQLMIAQHLDCLANRCTADRKILRQLLI